MKILSSFAIAAASLLAECLPVHGDRIRAADIAAAIPAFGAAAGRVVAPAPLAGSQRRFSGGELRRLALRLGLTPAPLGTWPDSLCFAYPTKPLSPEQITAAVRRAAGPEAAFEVTEFSLFPVPEGEAVFKNVNLRPDRRDGTRLLQGSVAYAPGRAAPVWARVRALAKPRGLVAARDLRPGTPLDQSHVLLTNQETSAAENLLVSVAGLEGMTPRRAIAAGTPLTRNMLVRLRDVDPGQVVQVKVQAGSARLLLESKAETGGYAGDYIMLRNSASGQRFKAKVEGHARASLELAGKGN